MLLVGSNHDPDTVVVADVLGTSRAGALCGAGHGGIAMKPPTAEAAQIGFRGALRIDARSPPVEVLVIPVTTEYPNVAVHVIQAPGVGLQLADPVGVVVLLAVIWPAVPAVVVEFR